MAGRSAKAAALQLSLRIGVLLALASATAPGLAEEPDRPHQRESWLPEAVVSKGVDAKAASAAGTEKISNEILMLVRASLLTLNDAMSSGNFSVLRDLIAPSVREQNTAGRLYQTFSGLIAKGLDLRAVAIEVPKLTHPPQIGSDGRLRVGGYYTGRSVNAKFDITYEKVNARWQMYGLSLDLVEHSVASQLPANPTKKKSAER